MAFFSLNLEDPSRADSFGAANVSIIIIICLYIIGFAKISVLNFETAELGRKHFVVSNKKY